MTATEAQERFDLFVHEGQVLQCGDEEVYTGPWPIRVYLRRHDLNNGAGARLGELAAFGKVLECYGTGSDHKCTTYAVLFEVASAEDFVRLDKHLAWDEWYNFQDGYYERPKAG
jgi:hypothetical protein